MTDDDLLSIVRAERARSIGFDHDETLRAARERALNYRKGVMTDVPAMAGRSQAVSMDVADAVEAILPDLIEIFTGGDDVAAFRATPKLADADGVALAEAQAQQETDYVNHVVFEENPGFMVLNAMFKDALEVKTGVVKWWWETTPDAPPERFSGKTQLEVALAAQSGEIAELKPCKDGEGEGDEPLFDFVLRRPGPEGRVRIMAVAPEDFTVAADTVRLSEASYCAHRSRPRAQDLVARGIDPAVVDSLPEAGRPSDSIDLARDTAGEHAEAFRDGAGRMLRQVEVVEHYVRLVEGDRPQVWRVLTGGDEAVLIEKETVSEIQFAAITPFVVTHRFYGESIADKLMEVQKIKTVLTRMMLDSGYFALNQRMEVDMSKANEFTIADLLRNEPAMPIRVQGAGAVSPIQAGALSFDTFGALEYFSTVAEQRTGVVRNAQGLNPDTLHDTAHGAAALMNAAQKRVRMIARLFAELGLKDLFLGVHALLRRHCSQPVVRKLRGRWIAVDPSQWSERNDMTIELGLGASGVEQEMAAIRQIIPVYQSLIQQQGGLEGPLVTAPNVYALMKRLLERLKFKGVERYLTDPAMLQQQSGAANGPSADAMKAQAAAAKLQHELILQREKTSAELNLQREKHQGELALKRDQVAAELELKRQSLMMEREIKLAGVAAGLKPSANLSPVELGGTPG